MNAKDITLEYAIEPYRKGELAIVAACYAYAAARQIQYGDDCLKGIEPPIEFPLPTHQWIPSNTAIENLEVAKSWIALAQEVQKARASK